MASQIDQDLLDRMASIPNTGKHSDFTIICEGKRFLVHKATIANASDVLSTVISSCWKEGQTSELTHSFFDVKTVAYMISYIYNGKYDVTFDLDPMTNSDDDEDDRNSDEQPETGVQKENVETKYDGHEDSSSPQSGTEPYQSSDDDWSLGFTNKDLIAHTLVYGIAQYYDIAGLKAYARDTFKKVTKKHFQMEGFINVVRVFERTVETNAKEFRSVFYSLIIRNIDALINSSDFMDGIANHAPLQQFVSKLLVQMVAEKQKLEQEHAVELRHREQQEAVTREEWRDVLTKVKRELELLKGSRPQEEVAHKARVLDDLIWQIERSPDTCPNARCGASFPRLMVDRKPIASLPDGLGYCRLRCGCRARLTKGHQSR